VSAQRSYAIVTGGGTAGHVLPAMAIADALVQAGHPRDEVHYVGSERGIEARIVPPTGHPMTLLPGRGIQRRLTLANLGAVWGLAKAGVRAIGLVGRLRPQVVIAVGGYASVAVGLAAVLRRVPLVVAEQNAVPGAANRLLARMAKASAVSFEGTPLPRAVVTGNPIRAEVAAIRPERDRASARAAFDVPPGRQLLLVFGGSLGALRINRAVLDALPQWKHRTDLAIHHVVGARDWGALFDGGAPPEVGELQYRAVRYEDDMPAALAAADVAVCRSGSSTCFEVAAVGLPTILVPSPHVTADQQTRNAKPLVESGGAVLVADGDLDADRLVREVEALLDDDDRREAMAAAARAWARPDAAAAIARLAASHARPWPGRG
jgi:UDP-N-acetylglucosamine--N-acetylmuramyl-(pentapeptide) pyrophosphoryl-undecaprenol N-acetylglucosamine transferase